MKLEAVQAKHERLALLHGELGTESDHYRSAVLSTIRDQYKEVSDGISVQCPCGKRPLVPKAYQCYDCGVWWCRVCAHVHFKRVKPAEKSLAPLMVVCALSGAVVGALFGALL